MKHTSTTNSDRKITSILVPIRKIIRSIRIFSLKISLIHKEVKIGSCSYISAGSLFQSPSFIRIGDRVSIGRNFFLQTNLKIGNDVLISSGVSLVGNDHDIKDKEKSVYSAKRLPESTVILEGDNLIGYGAIIVGNIRIGKGAIVAAGSVVTKSVPDFKIVAGIPAKIIKNRYQR